MDEEKFFLDAKEVLRANLCKYTRQAFHLLPELNKPRILDIGCGAGVPTMELAGLSSGQITGVDINQSLLDRLERKIKEAKSKGTLL
jgi:ubiquinone/menaquinone biosynthesis C-methylase UbiE